MVLYFRAKVKQFPFFPLERLALLAGQSGDEQSKKETLFFRFYQLKTFSVHRRLSLPKFDYAKKRGKEDGAHDF